MEFVASFVDAVNNVLWGWLLLFLLCGTGIYYTFRLRFIQVRKFRYAFKRLLGNASLHGESADKTGMSSFQALTTAIAAQVGT
ncbi:MAG: sodium:alanine symporter family protein, partial [Mailhella sp.]|nr:sodium:alanine symporter family protein [Mailhella sp.]